MNIIVPERFPRPEGSVLDVRSLEVGNIVHAVYGAYLKNNKIYRMEVTKVFRIGDVPKHHFYDKYWPDYWVVEGLVEYPWGKIFTAEYATDRNCQPNHGGHNNNYYFLKKEDAEKYLQWVMLWWDAHPEAVARIINYRCGGWL